MRIKSLNACSFIIVKKLSDRDAPLTPLLWFVFGNMFIYAPFAFYYWEPMNMIGFFLVFLIAVLGTLAQFFVIKGYYLEDASFLNSIEYTKLVFASILGFLVFNEIPTFHIIIGAGIIIFSNFVILSTKQPEYKLKPKQKC
ncbi:MAG: EamA family transporter [Alphaproteobacteria bacterium]